MVGWIGRLKGYGGSVDSVGGVEESEGALTVRSCSYSECDVCIGCAPYVPVIHTMSCQRESYVKRKNISTG